MFLSLIKPLERQLEQDRELRCVIGCAKPAEKRIKIPLRLHTVLPQRCDNITPAMEFTVAGYYEHVSRVQRFQSPR